MEIEFMVERFEDDDSSWEALFVKTPERDWHMAQPNYGTEDEFEIRSIISRVRYFDSLKDSYNEFLKGMNIEDQFNKVDDSLGSYDSLYTLILDGVIIFETADGQFEVGYETYDSGSYWEPPSLDYNTHSTHKSLFGAINDAVGIYMGNRFQQFQEADYILSDIAGETWSETY
jgi:hypothetical protein